MIKQLAFYSIFGKPLVIILGITTLFCLIITACLGSTKLRKTLKVPLKWHYRIAGVTVALGLTHGLLIILSK